jgi:polysaccharide lyase-like protein/fibronectin type III domain protein
LSGASASGFTLSWSAPYDHLRVAGYDVYLSGSEIGTTAATSYGFSGLACGGSYTLGVDAYDAAGNRSPQASVQASTSPCPDTQAPAAPLFLVETSATASSISLSWQPSLDNVGVAGYTVYANGSQAGATGLTLYSVTNLSCGQSYTLGVDAYDAAGNHSPQDSVVASTAPCLSPPTDNTLPTISGATTVGSTLSATPGSWSGSPSSYGYRWRRCDSAGSNCSDISGAGASTYTLAGADQAATLRVAVTATNTGGSSTVSSMPTAVIAGAPPSPGTPTPLACPGASEWSACLNGNWNGFSGFNGNPNGYIGNFGWSFTNSDFSFASSPAAEGQSFRAYLDSGAVTGGQAGQRSLMYIFPYHTAFGDGETKAQQGQDQWYRDRIYFPSDYQPAPNTSWNWVLELHNYPDTACCAYLSLGVVTNSEDGGPSGGQRLSLRILGGGDVSHPADGINANNDPTPTGYRKTWVQGPSLQRGHWYDVLIHVKWDYTSAGHVDWFLDGTQMISYNGPTLFWYTDSDTGVSGNQSGPGLGYLMVGDYRDASSNPPPSTVYHDDVMRASTRAGVGG